MFFIVFLIFSLLVFLNTYTTALKTSNVFLVSGKMVHKMIENPDVVFIFKLITEII